MTLEDESIGLCKREMDPSMIWDVNTAVSACASEGREHTECFAFTLG